MCSGALACRACKQQLAWVDARSSLTSYSHFGAGPCESQDAEESESETEDDLGTEEEEDVCP